MSDRHLIMIGLAVGAVTLYATIKMAVALTKLQADADKTISDVKSGPFGVALAAMGLS